MEKSLEETILEIENFQKLEAKWNGYKAKKTKTSNIETSIKFLKKMYNETGLIPLSYPSQKGGIHLDYYIKDKEILIEITNKIEYLLPGRLEKQKKSIEKGYTEIKNYFLNEINNQL